MTNRPNENWLVRYRVPALIALGLLLYVAFLDGRDLWYPDEPDLGEIALAMFRNGDWIAPRKMGEIWVDYPPMIYWAATIFAHLFGGVTEFTLRLPNALAAIAIVVITSATASRWFGARSGLWAGLALLTFFQFVYQAVSYRPDVLFSLTITAGLLVYAQGSGERPRWLLRVAGFGLLGLAMLAKGPLGLLLPGLVLTLWHGARREWRRLFELAPLSLAALAVYVPWIIAVAQAMGWDSILQELYAQNINRAYSAIRGHEQPIYYYLLNIWADLWPWSLLIPPALWWIVRTGIWRDRNVQLALWWFGAFFVVLSIAVTKRQLYLLPAYPAVALLLAPWLAAAGRPASADPQAPDARVVRGYSAVLASVSLLAAMVALAVVGAFDSLIAGIDMNEQRLEVAQALRPALAVVGVVLLTAGLWIGHAGWRGRAQAALGRVAAASYVFYLLLLVWVMPAFNPVKTFEPQSRWIREQIGSETHIGLVHLQDTYGERKRAGFAFYTGAMVDLFERREQLEAFFREYPGSVVLVHEAAADQIFGADADAWRARIIRRLRTGDHVYLAVRAP